MKALFEPHMGIVEKVLNLQLQKQNVIMSNIANINTPGYKTRNLEFESLLQQSLGSDIQRQMSRTSDRHLPTIFNAESFSGALSKSIEPRITHGEDRVNLDKEMAKMAKNNLQYNALTHVVKGNLDGIKNIIIEGSKV